MSRLNFPEFYYIAIDSHEMDNLAAQNPDVVRRLTGRLMACKQNPAAMT